MAAADPAFEHVPKDDPGIRTCRAAPLAPSCWDSKLNLYIQQY